MIVTHPFLFNTIVVLFIAFTSGWLVFVINNHLVIKLKSKIRVLEKEKEYTRRQILILEEQLEGRFTHAARGTVISLSAPVRSTKTI